MEQKEGYMWVDFTRNDPSTPLPMDTDTFHPTVALFAAVDPRTDDYANLNADCAIEIPVFAFPWPVITEDEPWVVGMVLDPKHCIKVDQFFSVAEIDGKPRYPTFTETPPWWPKIKAIVEESLPIKLVDPTF